MRATHAEVSDVNRQLHVSGAAAGISKLKSLCSNCMYRASDLMLQPPPQDHSEPKPTVQPQRVASLEAVKAGKASFNRSKVTELLTLAQARPPVTYSITLSTTRPVRVRNVPNAPTTDRRPRTAVPRLGAYS